MKTHTYDNADRLTDNGYTYDAFGNTTSVPQTNAGGSTAMTAAYYTNDLAYQITQDGTTQTLGLDPDLRAAQKTKATGSNTTTETYAYTDDTDAPDWISSQTGATTTWTRYLSGPDGAADMVATSAGDVTVDLQDIRGDIVATTDGSGPDITSEAGSIWRAA